MQNFISCGTYAYINASNQKGKKKKMASRLFFSTQLLINRH